MELLIRHKAIVTFIFSFLFCTVSLSVQSSKFTFSVEGILSAFVMPFQKSYHLGQSSVSKVWAGFTELKDVAEELSITRERLQYFESTNEDIREIKLQNARLRELLDLSAKTEYDSVVAEIISKDPDNWFRTIVINKGSRHGIKPNMPVVAYSGEEKAVVGKVIEVRGSISRVIPIISSDMRMGVMVQESRYPGLMQGLSASHAVCQVSYIAKSANIAYGERIVTSGQAGIFPPGLPVGFVRESVTQSSSAYQMLVVEPYIDYNKVNEVFIILKIPDPELEEILEEM